jgi:hypothetical protein
MYCVVVHVPLACPQLYSEPVVVPAGPDTVFFLAAGCARTLLFSMLCRLEWRVLAPACAVPATGIASCSLNTQEGLRCGTIVCIPCRQPHVDRVPTRGPGCCTSSCRRSRVSQGSVCRCWRSSAMRPRLDSRSDNNHSDRMSHRTLCV